MRKEQLETALENQIAVAELAEETSSKLFVKNQELRDKIEELSKQKADISADLVQYRTATFRLHESNAALLTLISKHQV